MVNKKECTEEELIALGAELNGIGVKHCLISLSEEGMIYTSAQENLRVRVPSIDVVTSVGAGDCTLAGFIMSIRNGMQVKQSLAVASAMGTAACLTEGTNPPPKLATANILHKLEITKI